MITKQGAFVGFVITMVFIGILWLATLLLGRSNHSEERAFEKQVDPGAGLLMKRTDAARGCDEPATIPVSSGDKPVETRQHPATAGSWEMPFAPVDDDGWNEELYAEQGEVEDIALLKEKYIRERFGMVLRSSKWIPTVGDGTNRVYITTGSLPAGKIGQAYEALVEAVSGFPPYSWKITSGALPHLFSLDAQSGTISGLPTTPSSAGFFLEVTDSRGAKDVAEYFLIIEPEQSLEIITETLPAAFSGQEYAFQLEAGGGVPPYAWNWAGELNEIGNLVLDPLTGTICGQIFEFCPPVDVPIVLMLSDAQHDVSKEFVFRVRTSLSILEVDAFSVMQSDDFVFRFEATGGVEPYYWRAIGALPQGLVLSSDGVCAGIPTEPGAYEMNVWVQDDSGEVDSIRVAIEILPVVADAVSSFEAVLSRNSAGLSWTFPQTEEDLAVRVVRNTAAPPSSPLDGSTICHGNKTSYLDLDVGAGTYYYAAYLESGGTIVTSTPAPVICVRLPPDTDPFADRVVSVALLRSDAFRADELPGIVLGPPAGTGLEQGSLDVVSLGAATCNDGGASAPYGGSIVLEFVDNLVWDGPGPDFTVFENVFYIYNDDGVPDVETRFMEPAVVLVSQDGIAWHRFNTDFSPRYDPDSGKINLRHPYCYNAGFAGVNPVMSNGYDPDPTDPDVSGGDSFDIAELGLAWIRYVWIQSTGNRWMTDDDGDLICHTEEFGAASRDSRTSGFDLDAVTAIWMEKVVAE